MVNFGKLYSRIAVCETNIGVLLTSLQGTEGTEGLITQVKRHEQTITKHEVYFALLGGAVTVLTAVAGVILERVLG